MVGLVHKVRSFGACDGVHFSDKTELVNYIIPIIQQKLAGQKVVLLVKGARCMQMGGVINLAEDKFQCISVVS